MGKASKTLLDALKNMERREEVLYAEIKAVNIAISDAQRRKAQMESSLRSIQNQLWRTRELIIFEEESPKNISDISDFKK